MKKRWRKQEDEEGDVNSYWMTLRDEKILEIGRASTTYHCLEN
jgi:hypothetical protein